MRVQPFAVDTDGKTACASHLGGHFQIRSTQQKVKEKYRAKIESRSKRQVRVKWNE